MKHMYAHLSHYRHMYAHLSHYGLMYARALGPCMPGVTRGIRPYAPCQLPVILALKPTQVVLGTDACAMSAQEIATIQSTMMGRNASCLYNMTLDSILLL